MASSGQTLLALLELARTLAPTELVSYVIVNRMTHVQTQHHREIERFHWARSHFRALLHFDVQGYGLATCPVCRERAELLRDEKAASAEWFKEAIRARIHKLDVRTTTERYEPDPQLVAEVDQVWHFQWETERAADAHRSALSYVVSARAAINAGRPVKTILEQVDQHPQFVVWRETLREVARRADLLQAHRDEDYVADYLLRQLRSHTASPRRVGAVELLRSMRAEVVLPRVREIVAAALKVILDEEMQVEVALLIKRFLDYPHGSDQDKLERSVAIEQLFDQNLRTSTPVHNRSQALQAVRQEFQRRLVAPEKDLTRIVSRLESYLRTSGGEHHHFVPLLKHIKQEIADRTLHDAAVSVRAAIDTAVVVTFMGTRLTQILQDHSLLRDQKLNRQDGYAAALRLRELTLWRGATKKSFFRDAQEELDTIVAYLQDLHREVVSQLTDLVAVVADEEQRLVSALGAAGRKASISVSRSSEPAIVVADTTLVSRVVRYLGSNIERHAVNERGEVQARLEVRIKPDDPTSVQLLVVCSTREPPTEEHARAGSEPEDMLTRMYGVRRDIDPTCIGDPTKPWSETWTFRRLR